MKLIGITLILFLAFVSNVDAQKVELKCAREALLPSEKELTKNFILDLDRLEVDDGYANPSDQKIVFVDERHIIWVNTFQAYTLAVSTVDTFIFNRETGDLLQGRLNSHPRVSDRFYNFAWQCFRPF